MFVLTNMKICVRTNSNFHHSCCWLLSAHATKDRLAMTLLVGIVSSGFIFGKKRDHVISIISEHYDWDVGNFFFPNHHVVPGNLKASFTLFM